MRTKRLLLSLTMVALLLLTASTGSAAPLPPYTSGTVSIDLTSVAVGIGASWGSGVLRYPGEHLSL